MAIAVALPDISTMLLHCKVTSLHFIKWLHWTSECLIVNSLPFEKNQAILKCFPLQQFVAEATRNLYGFLIARCRRVRCTAFFYDATKVSCGVVKFENGHERIPFAPSRHFLPQQVQLILAYRFNLHCRSGKNMRAFILAGDEQRFLTAVMQCGEAGTRQRPYIRFFRRNSNTWNKWARRPDAPSLLRLDKLRLWMATRRWAGVTRKMEETCNRACSWSKHVGALQTIVLDGTMQSAGGVVTEQ